MTQNPKSLFLPLLVLVFLSFQAFAQEPVRVPSPSLDPAKQEEPIRTLTEEVQLAVTALDSQGRLDPTLELADILVLEDGVAQEIKSARRVPAYVLLLL